MEPRSALDANAGIDAADAVFLALLLLAAVLERLQSALKATEGSLWWASNGRDVLNAFALATLTAGLRLLGFDLPVALAAAATLVVLLSLIQGGLEGRKGATGWMLLAATLLGLPLVLAPSRVQALFSHALHRLF